MNASWKIFKQIRRGLSIDFSRGSSSLINDKNNSDEPTGKFAAVEYLHVLVTRMAPLFMRNVICRGHQHTNLLPVAFTACHVTSDVIVPTRCKIPAHVDTAYSHSVHPKKGRFDLYLVSRGTL